MTRRWDWFAVNDESATLRLYQLNRQKLVDYARGITGSTSLAEDVVQEAWLRLINAQHRGNVREPLRYIYRIVRNLAVDVLRQDERERLHRGVEMNEAARFVPDETASPERVAIGREDLKLVAEALAELPEQQQAAIEMYRLGTYRLREIAECLGLSVSRAHQLIADGLAYCDRQRNGGLN